MIRSIVMHDIPMSQIAAMERWYYKDHAPEIVRRYGPWLTRHESYLPVDAPAEARAFGFYNWRVTDGWWREIPKPGPQGALSFTVPPAIPEVAACFVPAQPSEDFMGAHIQPHEKQVLRWFCLLKYPDGVSRAEGDKWLVGTHAPEVMKQPGLYRFFSHRTVDEEIRLPGTWPPDALDRVLATLHPKWDRLVELWYESFDDWRRAVIDEPPDYTPPPWATHDRYPFFRPRTDFVSSFILERPTDEFWRDARGYL